MQRFVGTLHRGKKTFWKNKKWSIQTISFQHNKNYVNEIWNKMERKKKNQEGKR
ncbi:hypothetical protein M078_3895 [Bacteroides fragilis str. 2-F-2 |nr:hypothetical protein M078_3895 [Bacteroides fragilis str. 2-F-2 \